MPSPDWRRGAASSACTNNDQKCAAAHRAQYRSHNPGRIRRRAAVRMDRQRQFTARVRVFRRVWREGSRILPQPARVGMQPYGSVRPGSRNSVIALIRSAQSVSIASRTTTQRSTRSRFRAQWPQVILDTSKRPTVSKRHLAYLPFDSWRASGAVGRDRRRSGCARCDRILDRCERRKQLMADHRHNSSCTTIRVIRSSIRGRARPPWRVVLRDGKSARMKLAASPP